MTSYLLLFAGWVIYFFIHSLFASYYMKDKFKKIQWFYPYYRIVYSFLAIAGLFILLAYNGSIKSPELINKSRFVNYISLMISATGTIIISRTFKSYSFREFIGLAPEKNSRLKTSGILSYVRHPIYSGTILIIVGFWLFYPTVASLVTAIAILGYLPIGIWFEEKKLIHEHGDEYRDYRKKVPAVIPRIKRSI